MKNIEKFGKKWITSSVVLIVMLSSFALLGGVFGTGAPPFTVTFEEHNLPVGTTWSIAWNNTTKSGIISNTTYSGGGSASVSLYNGSYEFRVIGTPWWFNKTIGKFTVSGASETITVNFIENFTATFTEAKLPSGTKWGLSNPTLGTFYNTSTASGGSIVIKEANSTTSYSFGIIGTPWWFNSTKLSVEFNKNTTFTINFIENFTLTVRENGLYPGISWGAGIGKVIKSQLSGIILSPRVGNAGTVQSSTRISYIINYYVSSPRTTNTTIVLKYKNGSWQFGVYPVYDYNISFPNMVYIPGNETVNGPIYYSNISLTTNMTIEVNFTPSMHTVTIKGYTNPNGTNVSTINFISLVNSMGANSVGNVVSNNTGFYEITTTEYANLIFYKNGYSPQFVRILSNKSVQWLNMTLSKISVSWNISQVLSIKNYKNESWIYNFNITNVPVNFTYIKNGIYFANIKQNEFVVFANLSGLPPFPGQSSHPPGSPIPPPLIMNVTLKLHHGQKYIFFVYTNESNNPAKFYVNASPTGYTTIDLDKFTDNFTLDPLVEYSAPQAVITAPSAIPYDTAITISGANSIASTNATITNYTWHITGPVNYTAYGKQIDEFFSVPGTYKIQLTVTDSNGLTNTTSTTLSVLASNITTAIKISVTHTFNSQKSTYYFLVYVNMTNNVSISQITVSVDGKYVNTTLVKEMGYDYVYAFNLSNEKYGYGNHTIKIMVFDSLGQYNSMTTYLIFGSVSGVGIISYIFTNTLLLVATAFVILAILVFLYSVHERDKIRSRSRKRNRGRK